MNRVERLVVLSPVHVADEAVVPVGDLPPPHIERGVEGVEPSVDLLHPGLRGIRNRGAVRNSVRQVSRAAVVEAASPMAATFCARKEAPEFLYVQ
jgi:hypothetical protein